MNLFSAARRDPEESFNPIAVVPSYIHKSYLSIEKCSKVITLMASIAYST